MGVVLKKSKEKRTAELEKMKDYIDKYSHLAVVMNSNIPNIILKKIRDDFSGIGKILFVRKKMAKVVYNMPDTPKDSFFLMFGNEDAMEKAREYQYQDFLEVGDVCPVRGIIEKQTIRDKNMLELLPVSMKDNQMQLMDDYVVCEMNEAVNEKQIKILKHFGKRLKMRSFDIFTITPTEGLLKK